MGTTRARVITTVLVAAVPGIALVFLDARENREDARTEASASATAIVDRATSDLDTVVDQAAAMLAALARVPDVGPGGSPEACSTVMTAVLRTEESSYSNVFRVDAAGNLDCSGLEVTEPVNALDRSWFQEARASGEFAVGELQVGRVTGEPTVISALPLHSGNEFAGVVGVSFELAALRRALGSAADSTILTLIDARDVVVARIPEAGNFIGRDAPEADVVRAIRSANRVEGTVTARGLDGRERLYAYQHVPSQPGAVAFAGVPTSEAFASLNRDFRLRLLGAAIALIAALAVALAIAEFGLVSPIRRLTALAGRLAEGDLAARLEKDVTGEVGELATALDGLAGAVEGRDAELRASAIALVGAQEDERRRIAGDVHDDSIQVMSALSLELQLLARRTTDPALRAQIIEVQGTTVHALARLRDLLFELHSPVLEQRGLVAAIETYLSRTFGDNDVDWTVESTLAELPGMTTSTVSYRIAQEALGNVRRHANARHVQVVVERIDDNLRMEIRDDGRGFDSDQTVELPGHYGLRSMRDRARFARGTLSIMSGEQGTIVSCTLPWVIDPRERATSS